MSTLALFFMAACPRARCKPMAGFSKEMDKAGGKSQERAGQ
jgi:hypothetical protein